MALESMRRFAGLELIDDALPDETPILKFRRLLERFGLTVQMMNVIHDVLAERAARKVGIYWGASLKASSKRTNRKRSSTQARVEHIFRVIKRQFGYTKVRYQGLAKNGRAGVLANRSDESLPGEEATDGELRGELCPLGPEMGSRKLNRLANQHSVAKI